MIRGFLPIDRGIGIDTNPFRIGWMSLAMNDAVLFQATTNYAAVHLELLHGVQDQTKALVKKTRTIRMIKEQLRSSENTLSNSNIGAVAMLAAAEVSVHSKSDSNCWKRSLFRIRRIG